MPLGRRGSNLSAAVDVAVISERLTSLVLTVEGVSAVKGAASTRSGNAPDEATNSSPREELGCGGRVTGRAARKSDVRPAAACRADARPVRQLGYRRGNTDFVRAVSVCGGSV
jgi:hypothetical protein